MYENQFKVSAVVVGAGLGKASTGTDQIAVLFEYVDQGETKRINWYGYFSSDKSVEIVDEALGNLGWDPREHQFDYFLLNEADPAKNPLVGKKANLTLDVEQDQHGHDRLKVRFVNSAGGGLGLKERMKDDEAKAFSARMKSRLRGASVGAPRAKPSSSPVAPPPGNGPSFSEMTPEQRRTALNPLPGEPDDSVPF